MAAASCTEHFLYTLQHGLSPIFSMRGITITLLLLCVHYGRSTTPDKRDIDNTISQHETEDSVGAASIESDVETISPVESPHIHHIPTRHTISEHQTRVAIPVPQAVHFSVPRPVPYPVHIPVPVDRPRPVPVPVPHPVAHIVPRPFAVPVDRPFPYPVAHPVPVTITQGVGIPVPQPYHVAVPSPVPIKVPVGVPVAVGHGVHGHGVYGHGVYGHGVYSHGVHGHGVYGHGIYGSGAYGTGGAGYGSAVGVGSGFVSSEAHHEPEAKEAVISAHGHTVEHPY